MLGNLVLGSDIITNGWDGGCSASIVGEWLSLGERERQMGNVEVKKGAENLSDGKERKQSEERGEGWYDEVKGI